MPAASRAQTQLLYLILGDAPMGPWGKAGCTMQYFGCCSGRSSAYTDVRVIQKQRHMVAHKVKQPHGAKVKAAQCLQRQPC